MECFCFILLLVWTLVTCFCHFYWLMPEIRRFRLRRQGIRGPSPSFIMGNIPEMKQIMSMVRLPEVLMPLDCSNLVPYFKQWAKQYGGTFLFALGKAQLLYVTDLNLVRELNISKSLDLGKPAYLQEDRGPLFGKGLITSNGAAWFHQRKTIGPQLYMDKIKNMVHLVEDSASNLVRSWESIIESEGGTAEIVVDDHVRSYTSLIIAKMMFGDEFDKAEKLFPTFRALMKVIETSTILSGIPFARFFPTKKNRKIWRLEKEVRAIILDIVSKRKEAATSEDLLQMIIKGASNGELGPLTAEGFILDNCKDIYLAGFEVSGVAIIWGLMLLAAHPEWQARIRAEVLEVSGGQVLDANMLHKMKVMKMVIQETLRLYSGVAFVSRQALKDVKLGDVCIPKDTGMWIWLPSLLRDPKLWGPDAEKFNPERFANGVSAACKNPQAYIPFGVGNRVCPGQSLAMTQMKVLYAHILTKFSLSLSPNYRHSPHFGLLLEPKHGVNVIVQKI